MIVPKTDTLAPVYLVPYDFDYTGLVDAGYAMAQEQFGTTSIKDRVYRGPAGVTDELNPAVQIFKERKERIMYYINSFPLLDARIKKEMADYLEEFYNTIENKSSLKRIFNAQRNS
jgi:hypothetical protein